MTVWQEVMHITAAELAVVVTQHGQDTLIVDCRGFADYNASHVRNAINSFFAKIMRKRLIENKVDHHSLIEQLSGSACRERLDNMNVILYGEDQEKSARLCSKRRISSCNTSENNKVLHALRDKLVGTRKFQKILILDGGFRNFQSEFPQLCESSCEGMNRLPASVSQPCLTQTQNEGPTQILPFLYLGSQQDALDEASMKKHNITHVLNLSIACPRATSIISEENFMRIPVNDSYQEKLFPFFEDAYDFVEKVRKNNSNVLIHCLAGISRSPTLAISYIMKYKHMGSDEAYRFVKEKRPTISPNFNFMGQLLEYEQLLIKKKHLSPSNIVKPLPHQTRDENKMSHTLSCTAIKVPKSASTHCVFLAQTPSFCLNENGKRNLDLAGDCPVPDRPRALGLGVFKPRRLLVGEDAPTASCDSSTFKPRRPTGEEVPSSSKVSQLEMDDIHSVSYNIPRRFVEELPSPSSELSKLKFDGCESVPSTASEFPTSLANPCFISPTSPPEEAPKDEINFKKNFIFNRFTNFLHTVASRPECLKSAGVQISKNARNANRLPGALSTTAEEAESPESGFQDGYKPSPADEQDRVSISSQSSVEITVL